LFTGGKQDKISKHKAVEHKHKAVEHKHKVVTRKAVESRHKAVENKHSYRDEGTDKASMTKPVRLLEWYDVNDHPIKLFSNHVYIIGHVETNNPTAVIGELENKSSVHFINLQDHTSVESVRNAVIKDKPIIFVGNRLCGYDDVLFPGVKFVVADDSILSNVVNPNQQSFSYWRNQGYLVLDLDTIGQRINNVYTPNMLYKIQNQNRSPIIHINGMSGSGKTTITNKMNSTYNLNVTDLDDVDDFIPSTLSSYEHERILAESIHNMLSSTSSDMKTIHNIFAGIPYPMWGLADYMFAIVLDYKVIYRRVNKRHIDILCMNKEDIYRKLEDDDIVTAWEKVLTDYKLRGPILAPPDHFDNHMKIFNAYIIQLGYVATDTDMIISECNRITHQ
jgi:hypothetical protein